MQTKEKKFVTLPTVDKVKAIIGWLEEKKARDIVAYDLAGQSPFAEALVIVTAGSVRHGQSLADHMLAMCNENNYEYLRMEGYQTGQWILVDLNDIIVNVFQPETRGLFKLESLWAKAPVLHDGRGEAAGGDDDL
ncbi:ribosome silencing factor [Nitratidesulfovibrio vulgaris]|jgi:ribosome-associated protein|uniref:Ribosomal silencing factor RsfS n=2 Tax=Nitratidesulfovibrio vulgaris TaxID=881 RepID=Q72BL7_NITV2|nr:ribosome silencing factor [Nitratidesulfovibrio vulgaris]GEB79346.1 ribosomal silencing factor RsfS [Desulfovibrio desulfuricans]HBW16855.1 ribosome silencing factor [Desulfovibrio sp.]AAS96096.1 iojap-related protein [Nitratidesulfovibrio vulgaris str. Hildenborough]ABM28534.1 iojap-like protein [Nitratidesulfovibrio vulgaris DP4]ADP86827.1 iojap-like protein [Nitratidesulfovibrio vulgaris RCH1]